MIIEPSLPPEPKSPMAAGRGFLTERPSPA
jgi:hypothetical protein